MEAVSVVGLAGSIVGIIDVATKSISALRKLQGRWKAADLTVSLLIGQLTTLKAALDQISTWMSNSLAIVPHHHQLVIDLGFAIQSCETLLSFLEAHLSQLECNALEKLNFESKLKTVLEDSKLREYANHLSNQATAMTLLLTALNCQSLSEQSRILECNESRRILDQVKDDSSSLVCLRDSASFCTSLTTTTDRYSMLSRTFDFDIAILNTRLYRGHMKSLVRRAIKKPRQATSTHSVPEDGRMLFGKVDSAAIDKSIAKDKKAQSRDMKLLLLGHSESEKSMFLNMLRSEYGDAYSLDERKAARQMIYSTVFKSMVSALEKVNASGQALPQARDLGTTLLHSDGIEDGYMPDQVADAISFLWSIPLVREIAQSSTGCEHWNSISHFLDSFARIAQPDYVPNDLDMVKCCFGNPRLEEMSIPIRGLTWRFVKPCGIGSKSKLLPVSVHFHAVFFLVDLATYNNAVDGDPTRNSLNEQITLFDRICNTRWLGEMSVILLFTQWSLMKSKLATHPLQHWFPDYEGGADDEAAQCYISGRFKSPKVPSPYMEIYCYFIDADDVNVVSTTVQSIQEIISMNNVKYGKILPRLP